MAKFEVFIPAAPAVADSFDTTLKVDAPNWMAALKAGLQRLGEQGSTIQNVLVDIQDDNSIHVTEPKDDRVFRIRELSEEEAANAPMKRPSQIRPPPKTRRGSRPARSHPASHSRLDDGLEFGHGDSADAAPAPPTSVSVGQQEFSSHRCHPIAHRRAAKSNVAGDAPDWAH